MKVVFAGPSIFGVHRSWRNVDIRPPAKHGDIAVAVLDGASVIGLIDGCYETTAATWHKELLFALSRRVAVFGGASIGALRAAECHAFGMKPVGKIAAWFLDGTLEDDDEVALIHAPEEFQFRPLTLAMVDIRVSVAELEQRRALSEAEAKEVLAYAKQLHFKERTEDRIAEVFLPDRKEAFRTAYRLHKVSQKALDAAAVVEAVEAWSETSTRPDWSLNEPKTWLDAIHEVTPR